MRNDGGDWVLLPFYINSQVFWSVFFGEFFMLKPINIGEKADIVQLHIKLILYITSYK